MNISVIELTQRLQNALDSNYNVVDRDTVVEVLSYLERIPVTKEQLETTRLAKSLNELRRKTVDSTLAKRSKYLIKKWRDMIMPIQPVQLSDRSQSSVITKHDENSQYSVSDIISQPNSPDNQHKEVQANGGVVPAKTQPPVLLFLNLNSNSSSNNSFASIMVDDSNQSYSQATSKTNNNNNNKEGVTNFKNVLKSMSAISPVQLQIKQPPMAQNGRSSILGKRNHLMVNNNDNNIEEIESQDDSDSGSHRCKKKSRRQNFVNGRTLDIRPTLAETKHTQQLLNNSDLYVNVMGTSNLPEPSTYNSNNNNSSPPLAVSRKPIIDDILSSDSCESNSQNMVNNKQHKHRKHKKLARDKTGLVAVKEEPAEPFLISDSLSDQSSSMSGFPAAYHEQLQKQNLVVSSPPSDLKQQLSFSGLFQPKAKDDGGGNGVSSHIKDVKAKSPTFIVEHLSQSPSNSMCDLPLSASTNQNQAKISDNNCSRNSEINNHTSNSKTPVEMVKSPEEIKKEIPIIDITLCDNADNGQENLVESVSVLDTPLTSPKLLATPVPERKKRGRRKGSKGIDSTLAEASKMLGADLGSHLPPQYSSRSNKSMSTVAGMNASGNSAIGSTTTSPIASYTSYNDIKQKIASASGTKKVKTTKELLADLQNRKHNHTGDGYSSVSQSIVSPSSSSEMSLQSQFTETESRSAMVSPDSGSEKTNPNSMSGALHQYLKQENNHNHQPMLTQAQLLQQQLQKENSSSAVDEEIRKLKLHLPPIDYSVLDENPYDGDEQPLECTCSFKEVTVLIDPVTGLEIDEDSYAKMSSDNNSLLNEDAANDHHKTKTIQINIIKSELDEEDDDEEEEENHIMDDDSDDDNDDDFCIVDSKSNEYMKTVVVKEEEPVQASAKPKFKSIFDDDYDDDNDPIYNYKPKQPNDDNPSTAAFQFRAKLDRKIKENEDSVIFNKHLVTVKSENGVDDSEGDAKMEPQPFVKWVCEEDPNCPAKIHVSRQSNVNDYHVKMLHDCYIDGINGNWNGLTRNESPTPENTMFDYKYQFDNIDYDKHQLHKRVVPSCNFLLMDKIPKVFGKLSAVPKKVNNHHNSNSDSDQNTHKIANNSNKAVFSKNFNMNSSCSNSSNKTNNRNVNIKPKPLGDDDDVVETDDDEPEVIPISSESETESYSNNRKVSLPLLRVKLEANEVEEIIIKSEFKADTAPTPTIFPDNHVNSSNIIDNNNHSNMNNGLLNSYNNLNAYNLNGINSDKNTEFKEWYQIMDVKSYNDDILTILPYVVID